MPPLSIPHGNLQQIVTAPPVPGIVTGWKPRRSPKPPLSKGGASAPPRRGDTQAPPGYFLPNHSSLFTKKSSPFHIGLYFEEVSAVNPSVTAAPCQLPLAREPLGCSDEAPLAKGGCLGTAEAGGFPRLAGFHTGLYFWKVPAVNPSVTAAPCQLPLAREPLGALSTPGESGQ